MLKKTEAAEIHAAIQLLSKEVAELTTSKGWREDDIALNPHAFAAYVALAHSELSEALDASRDRIWSGTCKGDAERAYGEDHMAGCSGKPHEHPKPVGVGPELADTLIRLLDMCDRWGVDLTHETFRVIEYGWTREYQHGGRTL